MIQINTKIDMDFPATCDFCRFNKMPEFAVALCLLNASARLDNGSAASGKHGRLPGCPLTLVVSSQFEPPSNARWFYRNPGESKEGAMLGCGKSWIDPVKGGFIGSATREDSEKYAKVEAEPGYEMFWATEEDFNKIFRRRP